MPIVVVEQEQTVAALAARLVEATASEAAKERAAQAIREANPGLDLDRLRPGMMVVVPRLAEARDDVPDVVDGTLDAYFEQIHRELVTFIQTAQGALEADKAERAAAAEVLDAEEVQAAAHYDPVLRNNLEQVRRTLADDGRIAVEITESLITGTEQWFTDLDDLSTLW
ncbi:hypothetical protein ACFWAT_01925 [Streptomyces syringium]|uniref:hypothetical protein n=1 Tax=Streptomyces syringium TaxID=76729 RepID=UPI003656978C